MTRVLFVSSSSLSGGAQISLLRLISRLDKTRFTPILYCPKGFLSNEGRRHGIRVHVGNVDILSVAQLARFISHNAIDVVNTTLITAAMVATLSITLIKAKPKLIVTVNNSIFYPDISCLRRFLIDLSYRFVEYFKPDYFSKADNLTGELITSFHVHPLRIHKIKNPILMESIPASEDHGAICAELGKNDNEVTIGVFGALHKIKGHSYLIEAIPSILENFPNIKFFFVGDGPDRHELEKLTSRVCPGRIRFLGHCEDSIRYMFAMDMVVIPSLSEGLPNVLLEALAMQKPVVATSVGGCKEIVQTGENGVLVKSRNTRSLAHAILWMLANPEKANQTGQRGAQIIRRFYAADKVAEEIGALLYQASGQVNPGTISIEPKLNILQLIGSSEMGGAQVLLCWLVHYFLTTNIKMIVACPPGPLLNKLASMGIETYEFRPGLFSFLQIALIMRATRPSIIHFHLLGAAMCGTIASFLAYSSKLVFTVHNPPNYPGMKFWRQYASLVILRLLSLRIDKFIAVSREIESFLANRGRISPDKLKLIHNGVSFPTLENASSALRVSKKELGIPKDGQVIGTVGRISFAKGQDILIEAFRSLAPEFPKLHCVIVGEGELRHNIETLVTKHEIQDRVHLTGFKEDVLSWYRSMDIIVFPSRFEGLPLSVIEAAYASKPIVATNIGGIKEIIQNEVSGLLVPPVDPLALAKAIRKLLENPSLALKLGRSAQTSVTDRFNIRKCGVRTMKMYRDLAF